ncbi:hypothetical protein V0288_20490 [Pannus brasiliensis CCIBt3594]|uniref:Uncharacterized protein n=1 Tax=Pannus brasiliensis CCIBt3594 TaxID=1427578 RepID=A0AAW9QZP3_9CHRO
MAYLNPTLPAEELVFRPGADFSGAVSGKNGGERPEFSETGRSGRNGGTDRRQNSLS